MDAQLESLHRRSARAWVILALAAVAASVSGPGPCVSFAAVQSTDRVGGVEVLRDDRMRAVAPDVTAPSGMLVTGDGQELWSRAADEPRAMASITKVMTAIVVLESGHSLDELVTVPPTAASVGESEAGLAAGQRVSVRTLLEAMLVHSANDAATALALHVAGSEASFVRMMNEKAAALDATGTAFANPHGLDAPGHHTTARDLATISRYALSNPEFRRIVAMRSVVVPAPTGKKRFENSNKLIGRYPGATGIKTGWTDEAGYCLVASAERQGVTLVCVVLGTRSEEERFAQARRILDWGFEHYRQRTLVSAGTTLAAVPVEDYLDLAVPAVVRTAAAAEVFDVRGPLEATVTVVASVRAPVSKGAVLGTLAVTQGETLVAQVPLVAAHDIVAPPWHERVRVFAVRAWRKIFGGPLKAQRWVARPAVQ
ncbi:MAG: D-alanyl-D-alanine carboxypeptidase [Coriobacteriia bacterium]|nr:D-alanyl-D-alanine carboxypeptidase [Coriobacteriia bacterium]